MNFFIVDARATFISNRRICAVHAHLFHGIADRGSSTSPHIHTTWGPDRPQEPLRIIKSGLMWAEVIKPSIHLVVSDRIAALLCSFRNISFYQVEFAKLIDYGIEKGDLASWYKAIGPYRGDDAFLRNQGDTPRLHGNRGHFFEMVTWRLIDIIQYLQPSSSQLALQNAKVNVNAIEQSVTPSILSEFPIFSIGSVVLRDDVFRILQDKIDVDFFQCDEYSIVNGSVRHICEL